MAVGERASLELQPGSIPGYGRAPDVRPADGARSAVGATGAGEPTVGRIGAVAEKFSGKVRFVKVQQPANPGLVARLGVTESPTVVFLQGGAERGKRLSGGDIKRTELKARIEAMLGGPHGD